TDRERGDAIAPTGHEQRLERRHSSDPPLDSHRLRPAAAWRERAWCKQPRRITEALRSRETIDSPATASRRGGVTQPRRESSAATHATKSQPSGSLPLAA